MDVTGLRYSASAHEDALTQIDLTAIAVQATGRGQLPLALQKDLADLMEVRRRVSDRLVALRAIAAQL